MHKNTKLSSTITAQIVDLYSTGIGTQQIASMLSVHPSTVQKYIKKCGILTPKQRYTHNADFFSTYTPESAYWAGFIMADGYVRTNRHMLGIHLNEEDKNHLHTFLHTINSTNNLVHDVHTNAWCVQLYSKQIKQDLSTQFNIVARKSLIATFPSQIPKEYYNHFIRGVMDGDGSITYTTMPTLSFVGARTLITPIVNIISNAVALTMHKQKLKPVISTPNKNKNWFTSVAFYGKNANNVLDWLYQESTTNTRLARKYEKYRELFTAGGAE
jgi:hypothetical protein